MFELQLQQERTAAEQTEPQPGAGESAGQTHSDPDALIQEFSGRCLKAFLLTLKTDAASERAAAAHCDLWGDICTSNGVMPAFTQTVRGRRPTLLFVMLRDKEPDSTEMPSYLARQSFIECCEEGRLLLPFTSQELRWLMYFGGRAIHSAEPLRGTLATLPHAVERADGFGQLLSPLVDLIGVWFPSFEQALSAYEQAAPVIAQEQQQWHGQFTRRRCQKCSAPLTAGFMLHPQNGLLCFDCARSTDRPADEE